MRWIGRYPVVAFVALTYLLLGVLVFVIAAGGLLDTPSSSQGPAMLLVYICLWTPNIAALSLTLIAYGRAAVRELVGGWLKWRVAVGWYIAALSPLIVGVVTGAVYSLGGGASPGPTLDLPPVVLAGFLIFDALLGPVGEELGWRGFMLPRLQQRFSALTSSLIVGLVWACWHIPFNFLPESTGLGIGLPFWLFTVIVVIYSVIMTWSYNNTGGSLLLASLFHLASNHAATIVIAVLGLIPLEAYFALYTVPFALLAIVVIVFAGPEHLSRSGTRVTR